MEDFNIDYIDILMFCQNKINSTKLKQMTKDERLNPWRPKISCKPAQNFVKCLHLNYLLSLSKMVPCYLSVVHVLLSFATRQTCIVFCLFARVKRWKNHYFRSRFINIKDT